ncbi:MAG: MFS transporter, partial [Bifidobacterium mongoliense]|nr:MFS transporter [Bifidobacterium mongoliense]
VGRIGRQAAIIVAGCLMLAGFVGAAVCIESGFLVLAIMAAVFYAGAGLMYSPVVSSVLDTLPKDESGRGVGMNDLVMNVAGSTGIAIIGSLIGSAALGGASLFGVSGNARSYANLLLICGAVVLLGLVVFLVFRRHIYAANR